MKEVTYTVVLPCGNKALETEQTCITGAVTYFYQHHTIGRTIDMSKYEVEPNGMIKGRLAEW